MNDNYNTESLLYKNLFVAPTDSNDLTPEEQKEFISKYYYFFYVFFLETFGMSTYYFK